MKHLRRLLPYLRRYRGRYAVGVLLVAIAALFAIAAPMLIKHAIDLLERRATSGAILMASLAIVFFAVIRSVFVFYGRYSIIATARRVEADLRRDLYDKLLRLPARFYDTHKTGDLTSRAINDVEGVRMMAGVALMAITGTSLMFVLSFAAMLWLQTNLALICILPLVAISVLVAVTGPKLHAKSLACQDQLGVISNRSQEHFTGVRVIRAFAQEDAEIGRFGRECDEYQKRNVSYARWRGLTFASMTLLIEASVGVTLLVGGRGIIDGTFTKGEFVAFTAYQFMLIWPMVAIGWVINLMQRGAACLGRLVEILDAPVAIDDARAAAGPPLTGKIDIRNLTFSYVPDREPVLRGIDLAIEPGWKVAVVGRTGSGKSALTQLLMRLYPVPEGAILLDGRDINTIPLPELRSSIGSVTQDIFLWSDKIRENIAFGAADGLQDQDIREAAEISRLVADLERFPQGYDQLIGERGITLSGGQKQRTAIARAVVRRPPILILDDALSSVDSHTEEEILQRLRGYRQGRTTIVITHRLSAIADADLIVVLDEGRIVERGRHADLVAAGGAYARMWESQKLEEELTRT